MKTISRMHRQKHGEIKYLKKEEWLRLIESVDNYRDKLIVKLLYSTGTRVRYAHIVHALLDCIPITAVQKQVGHKKLTTTQIYSNLAPEQVREAYEKG